MSLLILGKRDLCMKEMTAKNSLNFSALP